MVANAERPTITLQFSPDRARILRDALLCLLPMTVHAHTRSDCPRFSDLGDESKFEVLMLVHDLHFKEMLVE